MEGFIGGALVALATFIAWAAYNHNAKAKILIVRGLVAFTVAVTVFAVFIGGQLYALHTITDLGSLGAKAKLAAKTDRLLHSWAFLTGAWLLTCLYCWIALEIAAVLKKPPQGPPHGPAN